MVYVAPDDKELLNTAQCEVHGKRGGVQVPFPKEDDGEVKELFEKKKEERDSNKSKAKDAGELVTGLHVPPASENPETIFVAGSKEINKNLSTPGARPLMSDNVGVVNTQTGSSPSDPITGQPPEKKDKAGDNPVADVGGFGAAINKDAKAAQGTEENVDPVSGTSFGSSIGDSKEETDEEIRERIKRNLEKNK